MEHKLDSSPGSPDVRGVARRRLLLSLVTAGGAFASATVLPRRWTQPIVDSIIVPAHAQATPVVVTGAFTTAPISVVGSIMDLFVRPVYASALRGVVLGNVNFDLHWNVDVDGYAICGDGEVFTSNAVLLFVLNGSGGRSGNALEDFSQDMASITEGRVDGTLEIANQIVSESQLTFDAQLGPDATDGTALPGGGCAVNVTVEARMSTPYADGDRS